jgi:DNA-binding MarR family transcriptional regulator
LRHIHGDEMRSIMTAYGRQQAAAFGDDAGRFFTEGELTMAQFRALATLRRWGGRLTGRDLAGRLGVTPGTLVPLIDRLEEMDYLRRVPDQSDRRMTWLELTPRGMRLFNKMWMVGAVRVARAVSRLSPDDRATLRRLLNQIADEIEGPARETREAKPQHEARGRLRRLRRAPRNRLAPSA